ncbi:MAG: VWA domain-containing protein [Treponema sp.]|jgi:Ca-activated chloride channel family protein|nr:VWA domain-containing protein [Treponema sp.]
MNGIISFDNPWALLGYAVFIPLVFYNLYGKKIQKNLPENLQKKLWASRFFFWLFFAGVIAALAGPRWGFEQEVSPLSSGLPGEYRRSLDVVIALDVSRSMEIPDGQGGAVSRLERGLAIVKESLEAAPGMHLGVAVSRNRGIVAVPLTWDSDAVFAFLDAAGSSLTGKGTNLESLLDAASSAFQSSHPSTKMILLVSDGEALSGSLKAALIRCKQESIAVTSIAVGSDEGMIMPDGGEIISRRDSDAMRMAAGQTGGIYIDGNRPDASGTLAGHLRSLTSGLKTRGNRNEPKTRWFIFAMLAIIAFGASKVSLLKYGEKR